MLNWTIRATAAAQIAKVDAVYSALLTGLVSNRAVEIYGLNADCSITYIFISGNGLSEACN